MSQIQGFNERTIAEFHANHGQAGGQFAGAPLLLLHTAGARSGEERMNPVMYLPDGGRYLVFASPAGGGPASGTVLEPPSAPIRPNRGRRRCP